MQKLQLNDFCNQIQRPTERLKSRMLVVQSPSDISTVLAGYGACTEKVRFSDFVTSDGFIPMPSRIFDGLEERFDQLRQQGKIPFVIGLDGYLLLLKNEHVIQSFAFIKSWLDGVGSNAIVLIVSRYWEEIKTIFKNPKYESGQNILEIRGNGTGSFLPESFPRFIHEALSAKLPTPPISLRGYLVSLEDGLGGGGTSCVAVRYNGYPFPGMSESIEQIVTLQEFFKFYHHLNWPLSEPASQWIMNTIEDADIQTALKHYFFPNGLNDLFRTALRRMVQAYNEAEQEVLLFIIRQYAPQGSYLKIVFDDGNLTAENTLEIYSCKAIEYFDGESVAAWAEERKTSLQAIDDVSLIDPAVRNFITLSQTYSLNNVVPWLNVGLGCEKTELMRRAMAEESSLLPSIFSKAYPELDAYLHDACSSSPEVNNYFNLYRTLKRQNKITEVFCRMAFETRIPDAFEQRESLLTKYKSDDQVFLLIVDALGAEYIPMIIELAKLRRLCIKDVHYAVSMLPTSTEFNQINFPEANKNKLNGFDIIIHNGVRPHGEPSSNEENLSGELHYIADNIIKEIAIKLKSYRKVILTADHGASRLAVLAYQQGLAKTINNFSSTTVEDWRYAKNESTRNLIQSDEVVSDALGKYLVVRGYNRFSHQGGHPFELHGGASLEECLVPFIIFEQGAVYAPPPVVDTPVNVSQIEEDKYFDL